MYQAIVFLPLLGAILAGIIALVGAHARFPGGPPVDAGHGHAPVSHAAAHERVPPTTITRTRRSSRRRWGRTPPS